MKLYWLPLMLMFTCGIFYQLYENTTFTSFDDYSVSGDTWTINQTVNGTSTSLGFNIADFTLSFDLETSMIAILASFIIVAVVVGLNIVGSGMSDFGGKAVYTSLIMMAIWAIATGLCSEMFFAIPVFGLLLYFGLTVTYGMGIVEAIG